MIKTTCALALAAAFAVPTFAHAQATCAEAQVIQSNSTINGDTSTAGNPVGAFGPLPSPHNDMIYTFTPSGTGASGSITVTEASYNYGIFLTTDCNGSTSAPLQAATGPAAGGSFPVDGTTVGTQYYVIVSGNPSVNAPQNGSFSFTTPTFPVTLQTFSID